MSAQPILSMNPLT